MSKKEERLTKVDTSDLKSIQGGYNITATTHGYIVTGVFRDGSGVMTATFHDIGRAYDYAERHLLKEGEVLAVPTAPSEENKKDDDSWKNMFV